MSHGQRLAKSTWMIVLIAAAAACSAETVKSLETAGNDATGQNRGNSSVEGGDVQSVDIGASADAAAAVSGGSGGNVDSVGAFAKTVQPLSEKWCGSCHGTSQSPLFAASDGQAAHDTLLATQKVDFDNPGKSRLVLRLSVDKHNCPVDPGCDEAAKQMQTAVQTWADAIKTAATVTAPTAITSGTLHLSDLQTQTVLGSNPAGVLAYFAPSFKAVAPMTSTFESASGNAIVSSPVNGTTDANAATAINNKALGTATVTLTVPADGTFTISGYVNGDKLVNNVKVASFYVRIDGGALVPWVFAPKSNDYTWQVVSPTAGGAATSFPLKAGDHTIEIRQRDAGSKLARLALYTNPKFNPAAAQATSRQAKQLRFDLSGPSKIAGAVLALEVADYATNAYSFSNPALILPTGSVQVKDLRILINNAFLPQNATFTVIDKAIAAPGGNLSTAAMIVTKDQGSDKDSFSVSFANFSPK